MIRHLIRTLIVLVAVMVLGAPSSPVSRDPASLTAHEWGTFTSIAGEDGSAVEWLPLAGPQDLPCFVDRLRYRTKASLFGTVRMETPVIYLYAPQDTTVNVNVRFRHGLITEWFPRAVVSPSIVEATGLRTAAESTIDWKQVKVVPDDLTVFPTEGRPSHYYPARVTDASPLVVGSEHEKFLFYRGVGRFAPPVSAIVTGTGSIAVRNPAGEALGDLILFENRSGQVGYRIAHVQGSEASLAPPDQGAQKLTALRRALERILVSRGLYPKEAAAMLETWRDSWFEEGSRLFYIASNRSVDAILPLQISPRPTQVARVFVGRMELMTARTLADVKQAIVTGDRTTFGKYGRFVEPIAFRISSSMEPGERAVFQERLKAAHASYYSSLQPAAACQ